MQNELNIKILPAVSHILGTLRKDMLIALFTGVLAYFLSSFLDKEYSSTIELVSSDERSSQDQGLGSLLSLQGFSTEQNKTTKPLKIMTSSPFLIDFINFYQIDLRILNEDYDTSALGESSTINALIHKKDEDRKSSDIKSFAFMIASKINVIDNTPFVTMSFNSHSPIISKILIDELVVYLNMKMKEKAIKESQLEIDYLTKEMSLIKISAIKNSFSNVIEQAITTSSLANMKEEYLFEIIEPASINAVPLSPNRQLIFVLTIFLTYLSVLLFRTYTFIRKLL